MLDELGVNFIRRNKLAADDGAVKGKSSEISEF